MSGHIFTGKAEDCAEALTASQLRMAKSCDSGKSTAPLWGSRPEYTERQSWPHDEEATWMTAGKTATISRPSPLLSRTQAGVFICPSPNRWRVFHASIYAARASFFVFAQLFTCTIIRSGHQGACRNDNTMKTTKKPGAPKGPPRVQITTTLDPKTRAKLKKINPVIGKAIDQLAKGAAK